MDLPAPQQVEGGVDLSKVSSSSLVFDQWDSHHLGKRTRVVVEIVVSRETYRSLANSQEKDLNFKVLVSVRIRSFENTRKIHGPIVAPSGRSNSKLREALEGFLACLLLGLGNLFLIANSHNKL